MSVLAILLAMTAGRCVAEMVIEQVTKPRAKELGMEIRAKAAGPEGVKVTLEFDAKGELTSFSRVDLEMREGAKLLFSTTLREQKSAPGHVVVSFVVDRSHLDNVALRVVTSEPALGGAGYDVRVKDFVDVEKR